MRARLLYMKSDLLKQLGIYRWQVFPVEGIKIVRSGWKYPRETKRIDCRMPNGKPIMFYWYEVEILN